jgi:hypothetical protein
MVTFNPDGSLRIPVRIAEKKQQNSQRMQSQICIRIRRSIVSSVAPKKCALHITLSDAIKDSMFVSTIFKSFKERASVPSSLKKINEKEFGVEIGTDFRRCTDCCALVGLYREFLDGNIIEEKGGCTFLDNRKEMHYEDYFD